MSWPTGKSEPARQCQFSTCTGMLAIKSFRALTIFLGTEETMTELDKEETWLCFAHEHLIQDALKSGLKVHRSREGWVWVDNLSYIVWGWTP